MWYYIISKLDIYIIVIEVLFKKKKFSLDFFFFNEKFKVILEFMFSYDINVEG